MNNVSSRAAPNVMQKGPGTFVRDCYGDSVASDCTNGAIAGTVVEPCGGVVQSAALRITGMNNGVRRDTATDAAGVFIMPIIEPGEYHMRMQGTGSGPGASASQHHRD